MLCGSIISPLVAPYLPLYVDDAFLAAASAMLKHCDDHIQSHSFLSKFQIHENSWITVICKGVVLVIHNTSAVNTMNSVRDIKKKERKNEARSNAQPLTERADAPNIIPIIFLQQ